MRRFILGVCSLCFLWAVSMLCFLVYSGVRKAFLLLLRPRVLLNIRILGLGFLTFVPSTCLHHCGSTGQGTTIAMMLHTTPKFSFATLAFLVLYYTTVPLAHAQYAPNTVWGASSVFIENQAMYISGGYNLDYQSWTFLIDFTQGWDISAPASRQLRTSPSADASVPNALLNDQNTWLVVSKYKSYRYEIKQDSWSPIANLANLYPVNNWTQSGAADPTTGLFYIPNGFQLPGGDYTMLQYDFAQNKTTPITAPGAPDSDLLNYSTVWSPYLRKLVVFGGKGLFPLACSPSIPKLKIHAPPLIWYIVQA